MDKIQEFIEKVKSLNKKVVFPEGEDERILLSASELLKEKIVFPVLIGKKEKIYEIGKNLGISNISQIEIIEPENSELFNTLVERYCENRKNINKNIAEKMVKRPLVFGGLLVDTGICDSMVAGAVNTTANVIQAAALTVGYLEGIKTVSSFFIMVLPDGRIYFFADCAVNILPDENQLAEIGITTGLNYKKLIGTNPKIAFLSFSTKGSASHPLVEKIQKAVKIAKEKNKEFDIDGEFQVDSAINEEVARRKIKDFSPVGGKANVLIFPDLNSGNIAYKITQYLGNAEAYGPILQGFAKPVSDLSRGAKVKDIIITTVITCLMN
ncbi:MAG: phosphate acetyltransferase [Candidatus Omnitrophica bacterium]|nr:phosphate acetyltransferase [Candidatus Omnitrophota bacterium]MCM8801730.1 phosphate acetyltransferase [Candidatus Omnitrophota bacterium]